MKIIVGAILLLTGIGQPIPKYQSEAKEHQESTEQSPANPDVSAIIASQFQFHHYSHAEEHGSNEKSKYYHPEWFWPPIWSNWVLAAVGIAGICVAINSLKAIRRQARIMMRQAGAARIAAKAASDNAASAKANAEAASASAGTAEKHLAVLISKERARIFVEVERIELTPSNFMFQAGYRIFNYGPSPAFVVESGVTFNLIDSSDWPTDNPFTGIRFDVILPTTTGISLTASCRDRLALEQKDIDDIYDRKLFAYFYGFIKYRDVSMQEGEPPHETKFMAQWSVTDLKNIDDGKPFVYWWHPQKYYSQT